MPPSLAGPCRVTFARQVSPVAGGSAHLLPLSRTCGAPGLAMPTEEAPVSDDRHQQDHKTKPDLHTAGEPRRINHLDQVVRDESAAVPGLPGMSAQVVLQLRERAGEARE